MDAFKHDCVLSLTTSWVINNWTRFKDDQKLKIALAVVPKGVTEKHEITGRLMHEQAEMVGYFKNFRELPHNEAKTGQEVGRITHA